MRTVSANMQPYLDKRTGTSPIIIVEIQWADNATPLQYSDRKINGQDYPYPRVVSVSGFETVTQVTGAGDSQNVTIILDDTDGAITDLLQAHNAHRQPCWIYQSFDGLDLSDKMLLFSGELVSPIGPSEGERTVTFTAMTRHESVEVGFSMEEGDFPGVPQDALNVVWPLVFGQVCHMPVPKVRSPLKGYLQSGTGIADYTLEPRICQAKYIKCPSISVGAPQVIYGRHKGHGFQNTKTGTYYDPKTQETKEQTYGPEPECLRQVEELICELEATWLQQLVYEHATITIVGGNNFPQGVPVTLNINGAIYTGIFAGEVFTVITRQHPEVRTEGVPLCIKPGSKEYIIKFNQHEWDVAEDTNREWSIVEPQKQSCKQDMDTWFVDIADGVTASQKAYDYMPTSSFFWAPAGSEVFLEAESEILHIVSLLPGTVDKVCAYKGLGENQNYGGESGSSRLQEVPTDYYTVYETDYDGYEVVEIGLTRPLSSYGEDWDDELFVSFTSTVGPLATDIIEWVLTKYTNLTADPVSFADVATKLANYPCNFYLTERKDALQLIHDIAYQSRCGLYIRNGVVYIKYLSEEPTSVKTITKSDIISKSLNKRLTETESLATKVIVNWQPAGAAINDELSPEYKIILKNNINLYGTQAKDVNYYTQNTYSTILKSSTFWLIRESNSWEIYSFSCPLTMLALDIFDCVTIDLGTPIKGIITRVSYDIDTSLINFEVWTPIRAGETEQYKWAWPAGRAAIERYPDSEEEARQSIGYNFVVTPPIGHILASGDAEAQTIITSGDQHPSDADDDYPVVTCNSFDSITIKEEIEPEFKNFNSNYSQQNKAEENPNRVSYTLDDDGEEEEDQEALPEETETKCRYMVETTSIVAETVYTTPCGSPPPGTPCTGGCCTAGVGRHICYGHFVKNTTAYGSAYAAEQAYQAAWAARAQYYADSGHSCIFTVGQSYIVSVSKFLGEGGTDCTPTSQWSEATPGREGEFDGQLSS